MDGNPAANPLGFDEECLDPAGDPASPSDYIAIPFAEVHDPAAATSYHSLFCLNSLQRKSLECKTMSILNNFC